MNSVYENKTKDTFLHNLYYKEHRCQGRDALFNYIRNTLHKKDISRRYVMNWLAKQESHQLFTRRKTQTNIRPIISNRPGGIIQADLIDFSKKPSKFGYRYILNVIDVFSKKVWLAPLKQKTLQAVIPALDKIILEIQKTHQVKVISTDQGGEFKIHFPKIKHIESPAYTPQNQGVVERSNATIKSILFKILYSEKKTNWIEYLPEIQNIYNTTGKASLKGKTPDDVYNSTADVIQEIHQHQITQKARAFKNINTILETGTKVRLIIPLDHPSQKTKGNPKWSNDIYTITKVIKGNGESTISRYQLSLNDKIIKNYYPLSKLLVIPN